MNVTPSFHDMQQHNAFPTLKLEFCVFLRLHRRMVSPST